MFLLKSMTKLEDLTVLMLYRRQVTSGWNFKIKFYNKKVHSQSAE
jgi:hypothetical protein